VLKPDAEDGGFIVECPAIPGCVSEGDTVEEAMANIRDAIAGRLAALRDKGEALPARHVVRAFARIGCEFERHTGSYRVLCGAARRQNLDAE